MEGVAPYSSSSKAGGSTDVGDVSFAVPTVGLRAATWVPGTSSHSWQAVAAGGNKYWNQRNDGGCKNPCAHWNATFGRPQGDRNGKKRNL